MVDSQLVQVAVSLHGPSFRHVDKQHPLYPAGMVTTAGWSPHIGHVYLTDHRHPMGLYWNLLPVIKASVDIMYTQIDPHHGQIVPPSRCGIAPSHNLITPALFHQTHWPLGPGPEYTTCFIYPSTLADENHYISVRPWFNHNPHHFPQKHTKSIQIHCRYPAGIRHVSCFNNR